MASLGIHLAIGQQYLIKNNLQLDKDFLQGCLAPDILGDKDANHFAKRGIVETLYDATQSRVDLLDFCNHKKINTSYEKGEFFHILSDYIFYIHFLPNLENSKQVLFLPYKQGIQLMYNDYNILNTFLIEKYNLVEALLPEVAKKESLGSFNLLSKSSICNFIDYCAKIDIEKTYNKIIKLQDISFLVNVFEKQD